MLIATKNRAEQSNPSRFVNAIFNYLYLVMYHEVSLKILGIISRLSASPCDIDLIVYLLEK